MISFRFTTDIPADRRVLLTLPPEVPPGAAELTVTVNPPPAPEAKPPRTSLADWAEANAEDWGNRLNSEDVEGFTGRGF
jgi:hypothetical protein